MWAALSCVGHLPASPCRRLRKLTDYLAHLPLCRLRLLPKKIPLVTREARGIRTKPADPHLTTSLWFN